ncbi:MAG: LON peptidase substrate-binding domain-containing protein [Gammaproteobacteria bacterium]|nr:LON peptidase substrate-binding domain-containing protein [Gammaproteobacteria bacterium]
MSQRPIFPLNMTLFPGGRLPLQIFETRYIDMLKDCFRNNTGFVIVSIKDGHEVGLRPETYTIGTYAEIIDWSTLPSGLLGITVEGRERVKLTEITEAEDKLLTAQTEFIDAEVAVPVPAAYLHLVKILKSIKDNPVIQNLNLNIDYQNASELSCRLSELLPFDIEDKQALLELQDPIERLARVQAILDVMGASFNIE